MIRLIRRFFDDVNRIANVLAANEMQETLVVFPPEFIEAITNFRRRKPKAKELA